MSACLGPLRHLRWRAGRVAQGDKVQRVGAALGRRLGLVCGLVLALTLSLGAVGQAVACAGAASTVASQQGAPGLSLMASSGSPESWANPQAASAAQDPCANPTSSLPRVDAPGELQLLSNAPSVEEAALRKSGPLVLCKAGRRPAARDPVSVLCVDRR